jgi:hypothetical protein
MFYFANSSDNVINATVYLKGKVKIDNWDPNSGNTVTIKDLGYHKIDGTVYTKYQLNIQVVKSVFWVEN